MKNLIAAVLLVMWGPVSAETVTIDFAEYSSDGLSLPVLSNDFVFEGTTPYGVTNPSGTDNKFAVCGNCVPGPIPVFTSLDIEFSHESGQFFSLHSLDLDLQALIDVSFSGRFNDGTRIDFTNLDFSTGLPKESDIGNPDAYKYHIIFNEEWINLESVSIRFYTDFEAGILSVDNIVVTTVPIPAAVWLFGSALGGLGWMRRRKTA